MLQMVCKTYGVAVLKCASYSLMSGHNVLISLFFHFSTLNFQDIHSDQINNIVKTDGYFNLKHQSIMNRNSLVS